MSKLRGWTFSMLGALFGCLIFVPLMRAVYDYTWTEASVAGGVALVISGLVLWALEWMDL